MEVRARYVLMGLFVLGVIGLGFAFVYWLESGGGLGDRVAYRIKFGDPVAGLSKGSAVHFNGVRIGEVTRLELDANSTTDVMVDIAVERTAPIRADTRVIIEFQGLAGAPTVALVGGSKELPLLAAAAADLRKLTAEKDAGQSMTQAARDVLRKLDHVIADNAAPLRSAIANVDKFAGALARNSDKVDRIMDGIDRFAGGGSKPRSKIYELNPASSFPPIAAIPKGLLQIPEPMALARFETDNILLGDIAAESGTVAQWPDILTRVVQAGLLRSFESAGYRHVVGRAPEAAKVDYQLLVELRRFHVQPTPQPAAWIELGGRLLKADGSVTEVQVFTSRVPLSAGNAEQGAAALNKAFASVAAQIVMWACKTL